MKFQPTPLEGVWLVDLDRHEDERGFFTRAWCREEFEAYGIDSGLSQISLSFNIQRGTLRGMHYQEAPNAETKAVRCIHGAIFDVALDLRPGSLTYCQWHGVKLSSDNYRMQVVPEGCAHGFQTLAADTEVLYLISAPYAPESAVGVRWDDPTFGIQWPMSVSQLSERDAKYPDFKPQTT